MLGSLVATALCLTLAGAGDKEPQLPASTPLLPGDEPGPSRPSVTRKEVPVQDAVPKELVYEPADKAPDRSALLMLSYRSYATKDMLSRSQAWHVVGVEVSPLRRYARLSLITEFGIEGGEAAAHGDRNDLFLMQKVGLGVQYPHWVTPYVEFQGGAGVGRVELYERNDLGIFWSLGIDVGAQWNLGKGLRLMAAAGWIRPSVKIAGQDLQEPVYFHRGTFKVGLGF